MIVGASLGKWGRLMLATVVYTFGVAAVSFLIVPAIYLGLSCGFYPYFASVEGHDRYFGLHGSYYAVKGRWFRTLGFVILTNILSLVASLVVQFAFSMVPAHVVAIVAVSLIAQIVCSYFTVATAVWIMYAHATNMAKEAGVPLDSFSDDNNNQD
jgi:hypothetical protein